MPIAKAQQIPELCEQGGIAVSLRPVLRITGSALNAIPPEFERLAKLEVLRELHAGRRKSFALTDSELTENLMEPGDILTVHRGVFIGVSPNPGSVAVCRDGELLRVRRSDLGS